MTATRNGGRAWVRTAVAALAVAGVVGACTGDDGVKVIADDSDPVAALTAAVEAMPDSGRIRSTTEIDYSDWQNELGDDGPAYPTGMKLAVDAEFAGNRSRFTSRIETVGLDTGPIESSYLLVGDTTFTEVQPMLDGFEQTLDQMDDLDGEQFGDSYSAEMAELLAAARTALGDRRWVRHDVDTGAAWMPALGASSAVDLEEVRDPARVIEQLTDVTAAESVTRDGATFAVYRGRLDPDQLFSTGEDDETTSHPASAAEILGDGADPADVERLERIEKYGDERTGVDVVIDVDTAGRLRRIETTNRDQVEDEYRDCTYLGSGGRYSSVTEFFDLGADIVIEQPDPATVMDASELASLELFSSSGGDDVGSGGTVTTMVGSVDDGGHPGGEPWLRMEDESTLRDGADLIGLDPATIASMTDDDIEAAMEQLEIARESLPTFDTAMGEMDRIEMLYIIRRGVELLGLESLDLSAQSDQQLADLINAYLEANGGPVGQGPNDAAIRGEEYVPSGDGVSDPTGYDQFEGCPA